MSIQLMLPLSPDSSLIAESIRLARGTHATRTINGYTSDWRIFVTWCEKNVCNILPATSETVALYVTDLLRQGRRIKTVRRHLCAILYHHKQAGCGNPCTDEVRAIVSGAQRIRGEQPQQKVPITIDQLREMIRRIDRPEPYRSRDRAVLLFGFATALRRSSIVSVQMSDIKFTDRGLVVHLPREKQDQAGIGRDVGVPYARHQEACPVRALIEWLKHRGETPGPVFASIWHHTLKPDRPMHASTIVAIVKRAVCSIGLDSRRYAGHSLRAGFVTEALTQGVGEILTAQHTGHRSLETLKQYMRSQDPFRANACAQLGL
jgi:site-specific recombinase XerD